MKEQIGFQGCQACADLWNTAGVRFKWFKQWFPTEQAFNFYRTLLVTSCETLYLTFCYDSSAYEA